MTDSQNTSMLLTFYAEENESLLVNSSTVVPNSSVTEDPYKVPPGLIVLLAFLYGSISLLAVIGNGLVIFVIVKNRRMHSVTNIFIANLAVADVIIGMFSIPFQFQAALLQRWVLAHFMCSLAPFVQIISVNVSIITLSVIAIDRYIAVLHPFKAGCSKRSAVVIISAIWLFSVVSGMPCVLYFRVVQRDHKTAQCDFLAPPSWPDLLQHWNLFSVVVQYIMPLTVISFCYFRIGCHIWGARAPGNTTNTEDVRSRNKRKLLVAEVRSGVKCTIENTTVQSCTLRRLRDQ
ncbi:tachykinin-like peptides receptor 86C [Gigantopelta aegis]|uniref:tachykinin-like peptides receptor 86C n=1 Tax=Gigantopelta aegis TaxID=1735272 RepID=UPI001B88AFBA|nr:tachykinin-like peptides receptor 86C [Gigantopelta aegis]